VHTATLLPSGRILVAGGVGATGSLANAELYDLSFWTPAGSLATARDTHTATLLPSGKVLAAGGDDGSAALASAELYDEATGTWTSTGSLAMARGRHTATPLRSGKVLVAGGQQRILSLGTAELYDEVTGTWTMTGSLAAPRWGHTATLLASGKVLVVGGRDSTGVSLVSAELYDEATGTWTPTGSLATARYFHTATVLSSGKVLVAGGVAGATSASTLASAELYDEATGIWLPTGPLVTARYTHTATLLRSGKVLVAGGYNPTIPSPSLASAELYDETTGIWLPTGSLFTERHLHTATLVPSGEVLVAGGGHSLTSFTGSFLGSAELYDEPTGTWAETIQLFTARSTHAATLLRSGKVLVTGGFNERAIASAEWWQ
jgi:WD40 repeat protein